MKDNGSSYSLAFVNTIAVFERTNAGWRSVEEFYVNFSADSDAASLRTEIRRIAEKLGGCRICAGLQISGILYRELDRMGFSIFEIPECSNEILNGILGDVEDEFSSGGAADGSAGAPFQTDMPGVYFCDLQRLQIENPEISSKQALRDFLETVPFYELRLVCTHIPPWLQGGLYDIQEEQTSDGRTTAVIKKKQCGGG